jgi:hypothetical protein
MAIRSQVPMDQRQSDPGGRVLVICSDLFFSTQVANMVRTAGFDAILEMQAARAPGLLASGCWTGVVVDMETNGIDLGGLVGSLGPEPRPRVVAVWPACPRGEVRSRKAGWLRRPPHPRSDLLEPPGTSRRHSR